MFRDLVLFAALLAVAAVFEAVSPKLLTPAKLRRWSVNVGLAVLWVTLLGFLWPRLYPLMDLGQRELLGGIFGAAVPAVLVIALSLLLLDFFQYWTHRLLHAVPWLWLLHRLHHSDTAVDASTGIRHHPLEPLLNAPVQYALILLAGVPAEGAAAYTLVATVQSVVSHSNIRVPGALDRFARRVLVTPDMHRVHHSVLRSDANRNFGMVFPFWDYLFRTYIPSPEGGEEAFRAGVEAARSAPA